MRGLRAPAALPVWRQSGGGVTGVLGPHAARRSSSPLSFCSSLLSFRAMRVSASTSGRRAGLRRARGSPRGDSHALCSPIDAPISAEACRDDAGAAARGGAGRGVVQGVGQWPSCRAVAAVWRRRRSLSQPLLHLPGAIISISSVVFSAAEGWVSRTSKKRWWDTSPDPCPPPVSYIVRPD